MRKRIAALVALMIAAVLLLTGCSEVLQTVAEIRPEITEVLPLATDAQEKEQTLSTIIAGHTMLMGSRESKAAELAEKQTKLTVDLRSCESRIRLLIRDVYGIEMPINREYTETYARYRWQSMLAEKYIRTTTKFKDRAAAAVRNGTQSANGYAAYTGFITSYNEVQEDLSFARKEAAKYAKGEKNKLSTAVSALSNSASNLRGYANSCNDYLGIGYSFGWSVTYWKDSDFNEVYVDFR